MKVSKEIKALVDKHDAEQIKMGIKVEREHNEGPTDVVGSNLDLLKITLAHLEEDPEYYTKLKTVEEICEAFGASRLYTLEEGTGLLMELPYIKIGNKTFDLEFEKGDGVQKVYNLVMGSNLKDKHGTKLKLNTIQAIAEFARILRSNPQAKKLVKESILHERSIGKASDTVKVVVDIDMTKHAGERQGRHETPISEDEIGKTIKRAIPKLANALMMDEIDIGDDVAIQAKTGLNIIGNLESRKNEVVLKVITVMKKHDFKPKSGTISIRI